MLIKKINDLKKLLDNMIASESFTYDEILKVSQELDLLIVRYYRA